MTGVIITMGPDPLGRLMDEHAAALVLFARQWCAAAEDVVQEAFIKLAAQRKPPDNPVGWLYRVVRNGSLSANRSARRRQRHEAVAARTEDWFTANVDADLDGADAAAALQALPLEQREIIVAHLWGGLTFDEIAELTGTSSSTAHRWYLAGLTALRERLGVSCLKQRTTRK